jgi:Domain of unknown function (DUF222)/HNH endonuclease
VCEGAGQPVSVAGALGMLDRALGCLAAADTAGLPAAVQAEALLALEKAEARHTAARARLLAAFAAQGGYEDDGHGSARAWLRWQARITAGAAAGAVGWARRLAAHPVIASELAAGELSESWAREFCGWTDRLPAGQQGDADEILASAARAGVDLAGLTGLAREMYERSIAAGPGDDTDDTFADRYLRLGITFRGAGRAEGDLTPGCAAALDAVLAALGKKAGPEDTRTSGQRRHDALEEACRRLIASGMLPGRSGQPAQAHLHITLAGLRGSAGASRMEGAWFAARASQPGWLTGPEAEAAACDSTLVPIVTGHVDQAALDRLTEFYLATHGLRMAGADADCRGGAAAGEGRAAGADEDGGDGQTSASGHGARPGSAGGLLGRGVLSASGQPSGRPCSPSHSGAGLPGHSGAGRSDGCGCTCGGGTCPSRRPLSPQTVRRLRETMLRLAADVLSGPGGLASWLRQSQLAGGPGDGSGLPLGIPLPLDTGEAEPTIPAHLRRAVTTRHTHCAFPGCRVPAEACHIHHLVPRARAGPTAIGNLVPLCSFHHLTAVHRWGWTVTLHADGSTTATSPDRARTLHDHGPPGADLLRSPDGRPPAPLPGARRGQYPVAGLPVPG